MATFQLEWQGWIIGLGLVILALTVLRQVLMAPKHQQPRSRLQDAYDRYQTQLERENMPQASEAQSQSSPTQAMKSMGTVHAIKSMGQAAGKAPQDTKNNAQSQHDQEQKKRLKQYLWILIFGTLSLVLWAYFG
jgi:cytoskeletal protein RodZ